MGKMRVNDKMLIKSYQREKTRSKRFYIINFYEKDNLGVDFMACLGHFRKGYGLMAQNHRCDKCSYKKIFLKFVNVS